MNPYHNKDEFEVLDVAPSYSNVPNNYPKYPLANEPQALMRNTNYKDWLNLCEENNTGVLAYSSPETFSNIDAIQDGLSITSSILSLLNIPIIGDVLGIIGTLLGIFLRNNNIWEIFMRQVEQLIDQKIEANVRNRALAELNGLTRLLDVYNIALENWKDNPDDLNRQNVVMHFDDANSQFIYNMALFATNGFEVALLATYAQAANLHLLLLRDASIYGSQWGLARSNGDFYYNLQLKYTEEYTDHCITWYNNGLNRLRGQSGQNWVNFNRFRREMTLSVLDIIAFFPAYNYRLYPLPTQMELTREIYTDVIGFTEQGHPWYNANAVPATFNSIEYVATRTPSFSTWLHSILVFTGKLGGAGVPSNQMVWLGHRLVEERIDGNQSTRLFGTTSGNAITGTRDLFFSNNDVFSITSTALAYVTVATGNSYGVSAVNFDTVKSGQIQYSAGSNYGQRIQTIISEFPGESSTRPNTLDYSHRLSYISAFIDGLRNGRLLSYGWTHKSMNRQNRVEPNRITQLPAVKASTSSDCTVIPGPGSTGGNLVRLNSNGRFDLQVQLPTIQTNYRIRLRYACVSQGSINIVFSGASHPSILPVTAQSLDNLQYNDFGYFDVVGTFVSSLGNVISIRNSAPNANVVIDKIEFIPVGIFATQSLEKAEKAVNDLFTDDTKNKYDRL